MATQSLEIAQRAVGYANNALRPDQVGGKLRYWHFTVNVATADDTFTVMQLPQGLGRLLTAETTMVITATGTMPTVSIGHGAYTNTRGETIAASDTGIAAAETPTASGDIFRLEEGATVSGFQWDSINNIAVNLKTSTALPVGSTIVGYMIYVTE